MIIRQVAVRHGRSVLSSSLQCCRRGFADNIQKSDRITTPSTQDHTPTKTIPGHPSDPSSILDTTGQPPTPATREVQARIDTITQGNQSLQADINAVFAGTQHGLSAPPPPLQKVPQHRSPPQPAAPHQTLKSFYNTRKSQKKIASLGSTLRNVYQPWDIIENPPTPDQVTLPTLLANQTHLGHATSLWNPANSSYIFGIREGIHIISLDTTLAYLRRAVKVVREIARRGGIILFVGTRKGHQDIIVNAAKLAEGYHIFDRWVPGSLTNGQQILGDCAIKVVNAVDDDIEKYREMLSESNHPVLRPDLVIVMNPIENEVCLHECGLYTVPTIGIIDTDANPAWVTYPIPANDDSLRSVALIAGVLARAAEQGQQSRKMSAKRGEMTFDPARVQTYLEGMEEIASMDVQERDNSSTAEK